MARLRVGGSVPSITRAAALSDGAARGDLLTTRWRSESGGVRGGSGAHSAANTGADTIMKVWRTVAVSISRAAIG